jgi:hypothetical protein
LDVGSSFAGPGAEGRRCIDSNNITNRWAPQTINQVGKEEENPDNIWPWAFRINATDDLCAVAGASPDTISSSRSVPKDGGRAGRSQALVGQEHHLRNLPKELK